MSIEHDRHCMQSCWGTQHLWYAAWTLRTFTDWRDERNKCSAIQAKCPLGLLENPDTEKVNNAGYLASSWKPDARTHSRTYTDALRACCFTKLWAL